MQQYNSYKIKLLPKKGSQHPMKAPEIERFAQSVNLFIN